MNNLKKLKTNNLMELRKTTLHKKYKLKDQGDMPKYTVLEFRPKKTPYCLCIPVINEGQRIKRQLEKLRKYTNVVDVLLLDGGSIDGSTTPKKTKFAHCLLKKVKVGKQPSLGWVLGMQLNKDTAA